MVMATTVVCGSRKRAALGAPMTRKPIPDTPLTKAANTIPRAARPCAGLNAAHPCRHPMRASPPSAGAREQPPGDREKSLPSFRSHLVVYSMPRSHAISLRHHSALSSQKLKHCGIELRRDFPHKAMPTAGQDNAIRAGYLLVDQLHTPYGRENVALRGKNQRRSLDTGQLVGGVVLRTGTVLAQIGSERLRVDSKHLNVARNCLECL